MKTIEMPVYKLTGNCIWNTFRNSKKKHILITGNRGIGKTTLLHTLFPNTLPGITTWAEPQKAVYLKENMTEHIAQIGIYDPAKVSSLRESQSTTKIENKMCLIEDGFATLGKKALTNALLSDSEWISMDEIGYLEAQCTDYLDMITQIMKKKRVIAVVRKQNLSHLKNLCKREDIFLIDLDAPFGTMGCVIMASGLGKRFGANKLMTDFHGKPLISYILDATSGIFQKRVVVTRHKDIVNFCEKRNIPVIFHSMPHRNDTIRLGLENLLDCKSTEGFSIKHCMFCTADQPLLKQDTIASLALASVHAQDKILRPICENTFGSPVIFPSWTFEELLHLSEGKGGGYIIKQHSDKVQYFPITEPYELEDIDTQEDLIRLQQFL